MLSNGSEHLQIVIQRHYKSFFFQKITKNCPTPWGFVSKRPKPPAAGGPAPRLPSVILLSYTSFLNMLTKLDTCLCTFQLLVEALSFCKIRDKCQQATISDLPSYDIFVPQKLSLLKIFDDVILCDLWFRSPKIKNPGYTCE